MANLVEGNEWITAIHTAVQQWNDISGCRVNFILAMGGSSAGADITFYPVHGLYPTSAGTFVVHPNDPILPDFPELPTCAKKLHCIDGTYAQAAFPVAQSIGSWIAITTCFPGELTLFEKTNIAAHEIGHALGFRHANYGCNTNIEEEYMYDCPDNLVLGANHLWGTPQCDPTSLMTPSAIGNTFNISDMRSARMVYPDGSIPPYLEYVIMSNKIGNTNCRIFTARVINQAPWYQLKVQMIKISNNQVVKESPIELGGDTNNSTYKSIAVQYCGSGSYKFQVVGIAYDGIRMVTSNTYNVIVP